MESGIEDKLLTRFPRLRNPEKQKFVLRKIIKKGKNWIKGIFQIFFHVFQRLKELL